MRWGLRRPGLAGYRSRRVMAVTVRAAAARAPGGRLGRRGRIGPPQQLTVEPPMRDGAATQRQRQIPGRAAQGST